MLLPIKNVEQKNSFYKNWLYTIYAAAENLFTNDYRMDSHGVVRCITNKTERVASLWSGQIKYEPFDFENKANHLNVNDTIANIIAQITVT